VRDVDPRYDGFFEAEWLDYLSLPGDQDATLRQADFLVEQLALEPGASVRAINVFTSFGYFEEDDENERVLHGIAELGDGTRTILVAQEGA
jgi:hypothetical protein